MKNFDEKIRDKLFGAEMPVSDGTWDFIESQITERNQRPKYWLFFFASVFITPLLFLTLYYNKTVSSVTNDELAFAEHRADKLIEENSVLAKSLVSSLDVIRNSKLPNVVQSLNKKPLYLGFQIARLKKNEVLSYDEDNSESLRSLLSPIQKLDQTNVSDLSFINSHIKKDFFNLAAKPKCPNFTKAKKLDGFYLYTNLTTKYPFQFLSNSNLEYVDYIDSRTATESGTVSYSFEMGFGYEHISGYFLQTGLIYDKLNFNFVHEREFVERNSSKITVDSIFNAQGQFVEIKVDTTINQEIGIERTTALNVFEQIDLPFSIGYKIPLNKRFNLSASAGLVLNLRSYQEGKVLNQIGSPVSIYGTDGENKIYRDQIGLSYTAGLDLETQLNNNLFLNGGIRMRYYGGQINSEINPVSHSFLTTGLSVGLRYRI